MSLRVWLPLNGDLKNYGASETTLVTNSGATSNTSGKIGSCYYFNNHYISYTCSAIKSFTECSICLWVKVPTTHSAYAQVCTLGTAGTSWNNIILGIDINGSGVPIGNVSNGSTYTNCNSNTAIKDGAWHHLCFIYTSGASKIYIDGALKATQALNITPNFNGISNIFVGGNSNGERLTGGYINDLRVYDHYLSVEEIKGISQALVLHYPLRDPEIEPTTNIYTGWSNTCYNGVNGKYGYGSETDIYYTSLSDNVKRVYTGTNFATNWPFVYFGNLTPSIGNYKTISFDYYPSVLTGINFYSYNTSGSISWILNGQAGTGGNITGIELDKWNHIEVTIKNTGSKTDGFGYMRIGTSSHTTNVSNFWMFKNVQIEEKDHATPYTPSTRAGLIVYDCSGYNNNGIITGNFTIQPSPRNKTCVYMKSTNIGTSTPTGAAFIRGTLNNALTEAKAITIAWWANIEDYSYQNSGLLSLSTESSYPTDYLTSMLAQYDSVFRVNNVSGSAASLSSTTIISTGSWHHYALTYDGATYKAYRDGVLVGSTSFSGALKNCKYVYLGINVAGGAYRQTTGSWSDFRLYATALSADDVAREYHTFISIYKNGSLSAYDFSEV